LNPDKGEILKSRISPDNKCVGLEFFEKRAQKENLLFFDL
jgi:hypothetical protein